MPSGEKISHIIRNKKNDNLLGLILSCVSPENFLLNLDELKNLGIPFGFKLNSYIKTNPFPNLDEYEKNKKSVDPKELNMRAHKILQNKQLVLLCYKR